MRKGKNPSLPVTGVTWFEAHAYCAWLSEVSGRPFRLPTEAEWEASARGNGEGIYPWGSEWDSNRANTIEARVLAQSPVGAFAAAGGRGPFGGEDQAGNVFEWTNSLYGFAYPYQADARESAMSGGARSLRGGSANHEGCVARCAYRFEASPDLFANDMGFRMASSVDA